MNTKRFRKEKFDYRPETRKMQFAIIQQNRNEHTSIRAHEHTKEALGRSRESPQSQKVMGCRELKSDRRKLL